MAGAPLLAVTFSPGELPGGETRAIFYRFTLPPGETLTNLVGPFCGCGDEELTPGVGAELVTGGAYAVRLDAPVRVRRADGADEDVPAGTDAVLRPGDALFLGDYGASGEVRAEGADPASVVGVAIVSAAPSGTPAPDVPLAASGETLAEVSPITWENVAGNGAVEVRLLRIELPAGAVIGPYAPVGVEAILVESGEVDVGTVRPGAATPSGPPFAYAEGLAMPFLLLAPGMRRRVTNPGDEPAVLLVASIAAAGAGAATPEANATG